MTAQSGTTDKALEAIAALSGRSHREALVLLPDLQRHGAQTVEAWLTAARRLLEYDIDAGGAFVQGTREAERISETVMPWTAQALRFLQWPAATAAIDGFMKNLPRAFGTLGHAGEPRWAEIGLRWYGRHAESGRLYFNTPVLDLAGRQGIAGIEQLCDPAEEMFERRKLMLATYLPGAVRVRNLLGAQAIVPWATRGADIMQGGRVRGEAYFRLESEESLSALIDHLPGYRMADRNHLLGLLLEIWFERTFDLKESAWSPEKGRPFVETDGRSLYLPAVMPDREEAILAVMHSAGRISFGSFERAALDTIFRETGLDLPDSGAISWAPMYERYGEDLLRFQLLFDLCDDLRIDCRIQSLVPNYLSRLHAAGVEHRMRLLEARPYYEAALTSVRGALALLRGDVAGVPADFDPRLKPLLEPTATLADAFRIANDLYASSILAPVIDAEVFRSAYLPGRAPNAARAVHAQAGDFITAMAAVAGSVAQSLIHCFDDEAIQRAYVNNGGDIALHLAAGACFDVGLVSEAEPAAGLPRIDGRFRVHADTGVRGIATSGWRGRSLSMGIADSVTVLAASAAQADAAATLIANAVNVDNPRIVRVPADSVRDQSDLGARLVTRAVPALSFRQAAQALQAGLHKAQALLDAGHIHGAALSLQGQRVRCALDDAFNHSLSLPLQPWRSAPYLLHV